MLRSFIMTCVGLVAALSAAASPRLLRFDPTVIETDTVRFDGGRKTFRFTFTNIADKPVTILVVQAQCGCTVPHYSDKAVFPGKTGWIDVELNPEDLYGEQTRHLTVVSTNGDYRRFNTITLHGYVERDQTEGEIRYPYELGNGLRTDNRFLTLRLSPDGDNSRDIPLYNDTDKPVRVSIGGSWRISAPEVVIAPRTREDVTIFFRSWLLLGKEWECDINFSLNDVICENKLNFKVRKD